MATALVDVACKRRTNYLGRVLAVETAYQQREIDQHLEAVQAAKAANDTLTGNVARVLSQERPAS